MSRFILDSPALIYLVPVGCQNLPADELLLIIAVVPSDKEADQISCAIALRLGLGDERQRGG